MKKEDEIDHLAGIVLEKKIGDKVKKGEILAYIHTNKEDKISQAETDLQSSYEISEEIPDKYNHILGVI